MSWCTIESDPGVFTELISKFGVEGLQFQELYEMEAKSLAHLEPVFGLIFLFKWKSSQQEAPRAVVDDSNVFFAKQVINNACATQAILNVLLNRDDVKLGKKLEEFKSFAQCLPADMRGEAIGNSPDIRTAHNSFSRPEPFVMTSKVATDDDDVYHFVGYVPVGGKVYELDGLQSGPILLGESKREDWLETAFPAIQKRIQTYSQQEIRFNLLAIVKNQKQVLSEKLDGITTKKAVINKRLSGDSASMDTSDDDSFLSADMSDDDIKALLAQLEAEEKSVSRDIATEEAKQKEWSLENVRRKHNYIPFIYNLVKKLAKKGKLNGLVETAEKEAAEKVEAKKTATATK